jgi:hypothetical protein
MEFSSSLQIVTLTPYTMCLWGQKNFTQTPPPCFSYGWGFSDFFCFIQNLRLESMKLFEVEEKWKRKTFL